MSGHTPGPWAVGGIHEGGVENRRWITCDDGTKYHRRIPLAQVCVPTNLSESHPCVGANAQLIAAAPDYHDATEALLAAFVALQVDGPPPLRDAVRKLAAAHARARGES